MQDHDDYFLPEKSGLLPPGSNPFRVNTTFKQGADASEAGCCVIT